MRIRHYSFSAIGGAGLVAKSLAQTQRLQGHDADFCISTETDLRTTPFKTPVTTFASVLDNFIIKRPSTAHLMSISRSELGSAKRNLLPKGESLDVAHLHWVEGVLNHNLKVKLMKSGVKLIWTLHDLAPLTGGCHSNDNCLGYVSGCQTCPLVRENYQFLVAENIKKKVTDKEFYELVTFVAPSSWVAEQARKSLLLKNSRIETIPNPISQVFFDATPKTVARSTLNFDQDALIVCLVAKNLNDPLKSVNEMEGVLEKLSLKLDKKVVGVFIGKVSEATKKKFPLVVFPGMLALEGVAEYLSCADILVSTSIAESAGQTIQEAAAIGVPSVVRAVPAVLSTVQPDKTALTYTTQKDLEEAIFTLCKNTRLSIEIGLNAKKNALERHSLEAVSNAYLELYESSKTRPIDF